MLWRHALAHCTAAVRRARDFCPGGGRRLEMGGYPGRHTLLRPASARRCTDRHEGAVAGQLACSCCELRGTHSASCDRTGSRPLHADRDLEAGCGGNHSEYRWGGSRPHSAGSGHPSAPYTGVVSGRQACRESGSRSSGRGVAERTAGYSQSGSFGLRRRGQGCPARTASRLLRSAGIGCATARRSYVAAAPQTLALLSRSRTRDSVIASPQRLEAGSS
jgi:hypothetical protein